MAGRRTATLGRDRAAAFLRGPLKQTDSCAPNSACQDKRRGQFAVKKIDWQIGMYVTQFGSPVLLRIGHSFSVRGGDGSRQGLTNVFRDMACFGK